MKISILTMFPEMFESFQKSPLIKRDLEKGTLELEIVDIRNFAKGSFRHIDDSPFGGGAGMILKCQPVLDALESIRTSKSHVVLLAPVGKVFSQAKAHEYKTYEHLILIAGHYEGIDARVYDHVDELVSIGDYVLSGGELATQVIVDAIARLLEGTIRKASTEEESFENGLLEYPQYTQPRDYKGECVPEVLLSGNHEAIRKWKLEESLKWTKEKRPDLFKNRTFTKEELDILRSIEESHQEKQ